MYAEAHLEGGKITRWDFFVVRTAKIKAFSDFF